jgi:hypothetical protein
MHPADAASAEMSAIHFRVLDDGLANAASLASKLLATNTPAKTELYYASPSSDCAIKNRHGRMHNQRVALKQLYGTRRGNLELLVRSSTIGYRYFIFFVREDP